MKNKKVMSILVVAAAICSASASAVTTIQPVGKDNFPLAVAPQRTGTFATSPGNSQLPQIYLYAGSTPTPMAEGDLCSTLTTGIRTYDVSNKSNPTFLNFVSSPKGTYPAFLQTVHLTSGQDILLVTNGSCLLNTSNSGGKGITDNSPLFNNNSLSGFDVYDLSNPALPKLISTNNLPGLTNGSGHDTFSQNGKMYSIVGTGGPGSNSIYFIMDVTNPKKPVRIREIQPTNAAGTAFIWPNTFTVNGYGKNVSSGVPQVRNIKIGTNTKQVAFLPVADAGVILFDLTEITGTATNSARILSQMPVPAIDPIVGGISNGDTYSISVSADGKYAATVDGSGANTRLSAQFGSVFLTTAVQGALTQPVPFTAEGEAFITKRLTDNATVTGLTEACGSVVAAPAVGEYIAVIGRGTCAFGDKATNLAAAGYKGMIVVNNLKFSGSFLMGGGLRTDDFRSLLVSFEEGTNASLIPDGAVIKLTETFVPFGYTTLWDLSNPLAPKSIKNITTNHSTFAGIVNPNVSFTHSFARLETVNEKEGRLYLAAGGDGFNVFELKNLNSNNPSVVNTLTSGLIAIDVNEVSAVDVLAKSVLVDYLNTNYTFEGTPIANTQKFVPGKINNEKILLGTADVKGLFIYNDQ